MVALVGAPRPGSKGRAVAPRETSYSAVARADQYQFAEDGGRYRDSGDDWKEDNR